MLTNVFDLILLSQLLQKVLIVTCPLADRQLRDFELIYT